MGGVVSSEFLRGGPGRVRWAEVMHITAIYSFTTLPALLAARISRKRILLSPRGAFGPWSQQQHRVKKALFVAVVPNGIDTAEFASLPRESGRRLRHAASLNSDHGPLIGCLGKIHPKTGLHRLS